MGIGHGEHIVDIAANDRKGELAQVLRLRAVGNGAGHVDVDDGSGTERLLAVVAGLRLDAVELAVGRQRAGRQGRSGEQATTAETHEQCIERTDLLEQFHSRSALSGDDIGMVIWRDQCHAVLLREVAADLLAIIDIAVVEHDVAAVASGCGDLRGRRVVGHDDGRRHTEQPGRQRNGLRMISR